MKRIPFLLVFVIFASCVSRNSEKYVLNISTIIVKAKFFKIETKNGIHIFHFKNDSMEGVFVKVADSSRTDSNFRKIKLNEKYTLVLSKQLSYGNTDNVEYNFTDNGVLIWKTGMKSKYFTGCKNIVGNKINPRFTMIKYINPKLLNK